MTRYLCGSCHATGCSDCHFKGTIGADAPIPDTLTLPASVVREVAKVLGAIRDRTILWKRAQAAEQLRAIHPMAEEALALLESHLPKESS
jgi:hypothetical protein